MGAASGTRLLNQDILHLVKLGIDEISRCRFAGIAQARRPLANEGARQLRHARRRRSLARRIGKDMQPSQPGFCNNIERVGEHLFALGWETGNEISAEGDVGAECAQFGANAENIGPIMTPLHALQHHVVTGLNAEMDMRHQAWLMGNQLLEIIIDFRWINGRKTQPRQLRHRCQHTAHRLAEARRARQIAAIGAEIHAGQN